MIMYAHLVDNVVREISKQPVGYPSEMQWVECPDDTKQLATYDPSSKTFTAYVPPTKETVIDPGGAKVPGENIDNDPGKK